MFAHIVSTQVIQSLLQLSFWIYCLFPPPFTRSRELVSVTLFQFQWIVTSDSWGSFHCPFLRNEEFYSIGKAGPQGPVTDLCPFHGPALFCCSQYDQGSSLGNLPGSSCQHLGDVSYPRASYRRYHWFPLPFHNCRMVLLLMWDG